MTNIEVSSALWATRLLPQGLIAAWLRPDGAQVQKGQPVAVVRVEDADHEILAPVAGKLEVLSEANSVIFPDACIGRIWA